MQVFNGNRESIRLNHVVIQALFALQSSTALIEAHISMTGARPRPWARRASIVTAQIDVEVLHVHVCAEQ